MYTCAMAIVRDKMYIYTIWYDLVFFLSYIDSLELILQRKP